MNQTQHECNWFSVYFHVFIWSLLKTKSWKLTDRCWASFSLLKHKIVLDILQWFKLIFQFYVRLSASCAECFELCLYHSEIHLPTLIAWTLSLCICSWKLKWNTLPVLEPHLGSPFPLLCSDTVIPFLLSLFSFCLYSWGTFCYLF